MIEELLVRALCAAVAAVGFGAVSNPSRKSFLPIALLAASGYALRYFLMQGAALDIASSTLMAGLLIGFGSLLLGGWVCCPMTTLYIPALLPMVPGMYAYKAVFAIILFMQNVGDPALAMPYLNDFFLNVIVSVTVILSMTVGASLPMFLFSHRAKSLTRHRDEMLSRRIFARLRENGPGTRFPERVAGSGTVPKDGQPDGGSRQMMGRGVAGIFKEKNKEERPGMRPACGMAEEPVAGKGGEEEA